MSGLTAETIHQVRMRHRVPVNVFVETGTYRGERAQLASEQFGQVFTIERSLSLYEDAVYHFGTNPRISFRHGDTREVLPILCETIREPVFFFLDAHWGPKDGMDQGDKALPLWDELRAIRHRPYADIVVVDDLKSFGTTNPTPEWLRVSGTRIYEALGQASYVLNDHCVVLL